MIDNNNHLYIVPDPIRALEYYKRGVEKPDSITIKKVDVHGTEVIKAWSSSGSFHRSGEHLFTLPAHWTEDDIMLHLLLSVEAHVKGERSGRREIQQELRWLINAKEEEE